jgi:Tfp pilus assembly PilM family ATPase
LTKFSQKNGLSNVSVSVPEEKAYLFQTDVAGGNIKDIAQNIEFKLEENVPLSAKDAVFYFDLMPLEATGGVLRASVSVVPRTYIDKQVSLLQKSGVLPIAFEVVPKSIARAALKNSPGKTSMIVHVMKNKTGIYLVSSGVVCFTSTVVWGSSPDYVELLSQEISHTFTYWSSKSGSRIDEIVLAGSKSLEYRSRLASTTSVEGRPVTIVDVWRNVLDIESYIPPISMKDSLDYVVVAGLAIDS